MPRDLVIARAVGSRLPVLWSRVPKAMDPVMDEARQHGLASGVTVTVGGRRGWGGALLSLTSDRPPETSMEMTERHKSHMTGQALLLAKHLHEALANLPSSCPEKPNILLTPRERECLQWSAAGKTSWEMAMIIGASERTANFHIGNAMHKLGVLSRHHAVAWALSLRIICLCPVSSDSRPISAYVEKSRQFCDMVLQKLTNDFSPSPELFPIPRPTAPFTRTMVDLARWFLLYGLKAIHGSKHVEIEYIQLLCLDPGPAHRTCRL